MTISPTFVRRVALPITGGLVISASLALAGPLNSAAADTGPQTFIATGAAQSYSVPSWASQLQVTASGAQGGGAGGGKGGVTTAIVAVTPSSTVQINVGGQGSDSAGGFNGGGGPGTGTAGGSGQQGGGGASDIRIGGVALSDRVVIAAGGGGGAGGLAAAANGGGGGNPAGADGSVGVFTFGYGGVGTGGTQSAGGLAGLATGTAGNAGAVGAIAVGGAGGNYAAEPRGGSGGGGGYYGGGGGGAGNGVISLTHLVKGSGGPGGGGSSYVTSPASAPTYTTGANEGSGQIVIQAVGTPTVANLSASDVRADSVTFSAQATTRNSAITNVYFKYASSSGGVDAGTLVNGSPATKATGLLNSSGSGSGLEPNTTYYYKAYAVSFAGTNTTAVQSFTTSGEPTAVTGGVFLTDDDSTIAGGTVNNEGAGPGSTARVYYSTSSSVVASGGGSYVASAANPIMGTNNFNLEIPISGLQPATTYYYRIQAANQQGTGYGAIKSFVTVSSAANVTAIFPANPVGNRSATYSASVSAFGGGPLSGSVVFKGVDPLNRAITVCTARVSNGSGSCAGTIPVGTSFIDAVFSGAGYTGDVGSTAVVARGVSVKVDKVRGKGANRKVNLSGKTTGARQTVTIYLTKNGKTKKIGTDKSNRNGTWAKSNVALKAGGNVKVFGKVKKMSSTKVNV